MEKRRRAVLTGLVAVSLLVAVFTTQKIISPPIEVYAKQWTGLSGPWGVVIGDYDNDGLNDIAMTEYLSGKVTVYKNDGTTIIKQWTGLNSPVGVAIGDYSNDGLNDLALTEWKFDPDTLIITGNVTVYESDGTTIIKQWALSNSPAGVAIGDYDNDGLNDLAFTEFNPPSTVTVYKSDGTTIIKQWTGLGNSYGVDIGDYDNDGLNDIAITDAGYLPTVTVYKSDGTTIIKQWTLASPAHGVAIDDCNNDGLNDITFTENGNLYDNVTAYKSDGATIIKQWTGQNFPPDVAIGDLNNDGLNDVAFSEYYANRVTVYYQTKPRTVARVAEPTIVTLRGTLTNTTGYPIQSGSIRVTIKDSASTQMWQDTFNNIIDNGKYSIPLGTQTPLRLIKGQIYNAILEVDADSPTFVSADVIFGDNNPLGDLIQFVAE